MVYKVLYLEDEDCVAEIGIKMFKACNCEVEWCKNGEEAIRLFKDTMQTNNLFSFAVFDIIVQKGMGGLEAMKKIKELNPNFKVIATSGFADFNIDADYRKLGFDHFLAKPFLLQDIKKAIAEIGRCINYA